MPGAANVGPFFLALPGLISCISTSCIWEVLAHYWSASEATRSRRKVRVP